MKGIHNPTIILESLDDARLGKADVLQQQDNQEDSQSSHCNHEVKRRFEDQAIIVLLVMGQIVPSVYDHFNKCVTTANIFPKIIWNGIQFLFDALSQRVLIAIADSTWVMC